MDRINKDVEYWRDEIWADIELGTTPEILVFEALGRMEDVQKELQKWHDWRLRMIERGEWPTVIEDNPTGETDRHGNIKKNFRA